MTLKEKRAIQAINENGALLVFPVKNSKEPHSLWSVLHPRTPMKWSWDEFGDDRVGQMWSLMKSLSDCREVVYSKWFRGRATFFSKELFKAMLKTAQSQSDLMQGLSSEARLILEVLESDSPLSTKELKRATELQGKYNESLYQKAMKQLFQRFLIVAYGEVDDGAFPSLAVAATQTIYEDLWKEAQQMSAPRAKALVDEFLPEGSAFRKFFDKSR